MTAPTIEPASLADPALFAEGDPHGLWRWMRAHAPVHWHPPGELPGFWSLTRYEDARAVYRDAQTFSSARGVLLRPVRCGEDPGNGRTIALTDPPRHRRMRGLIAGWFAERAVRSVEESMRPLARRLIARAAERGACDFVDDLAARFSLSVICGIIGVPERDHDDLFRWSNAAFDAKGIAHQRVMQYFLDLIYDRMAEPADDLISALVHGKVDGELLTEEEILLNCENLLGATENGRLALIGGMHAFLEHPAQWERLRAERGLLATAGEEVLRWTSSGTHSMRTVTRETSVRGARMRPGERVVVWLPSANRDESVFPDPDRFDMTRTPNRHLALGGGEHFCIGATLVRAEMRVLFDELLESGHRIEQAGPAVPVRSIAVSGLAHLPVRMTAR
ncbi:cytochrome P450 [Nonomuraea endophytica]|uniref:cytochrome P450 n=1 Tax=Nonomuraea endophytica TaxID=714136 RepID=UPI0037C99A8C